MSIRQALRKQSDPASRKRGRETGNGAQRWCGSNAILAMMTAILAIVCTIEILHG